MMYQIYYHNHKGKKVSALKTPLPEREAKKWLAVFQKDEGKFRIKHFMEKIENLKIELSKMLNNRTYGQETTAEVRGFAKENGLVIVFGYSDDNTEFEGAIDEEIPSWEGRKIFFNKDGSNFTDKDGNVFLTYHEEKESAEKNCIEAVWSNGSWSYNTEIPHETFDIIEDEEIFCRGIVFSISDLL